MSADVRVHPLLRVPPPLLFVVTFFAGIGLNRLMPLSLHGLGVDAVWHVLGKGLVAAGILLAVSCVGLFVFSRTTLIPFGSASRLLTVGPYRFSRNPMYVSLVLVYLGVSAILGQAWPLIVLPLPIAVMHGLVIPFEESRMHSLFGDDFASYCARVRRWL